MEKLKERWGLTSNWEVLAIIIAFSINGSFATFIVRPILGQIGVTKENLNVVVFYILYIVPVIFVYQFTLPYVGWLVGQYRFFKNMQTKMMVRMKLKKA
ncbi:DUF6787 family protein [Wenyingzhuangia marina]|uniref:DUF6787 domain-containing protein n=1 Tax=Wenyingzhuangia marina TaxID=1195760 RepID=A0A1M5UEC9_9FLAO|nr:DUF6787 family protein [Wenyingzhuangia marina]GGF68181.1 hypothetical protein GCM10011397_08890 [Wenyingzhuangia marina]SHH61402.1 hypothetical protein SAMN05444281_1208 [Wenyingzhuangia marina]